MGDWTYDQVRELVRLDSGPPDRTQRWVELMADLLAVKTRERAVPSMDPTRHEAGHALVAICIGNQFARVVAHPGRCRDCPPYEMRYEWAGHICDLIDCGPLTRAASGWGGGVAEGTLWGADDDVAAIHHDGLATWAGPGSPFAIACAAVEEHAVVLDVLSEALAAAGELTYAECRAIVPIHHHDDWPDWA